MIRSPLTRWFQTAFLLATALGPAWPLALAWVACRYDGWLVRHALRLSLLQAGAVAGWCALQVAFYATGQSDGPFTFAALDAVLGVGFALAAVPPVAVGIWLDPMPARARPLPFTGVGLRYLLLPGGGHELLVPSAPALRALPAEPTRVDQRALAAPRLAVPRQEEPTFVSRFAPRPEDATEWVRGPGVLVAPDSAGR